LYSYKTINQDGLKEDSMRGLDDIIGGNQRAAAKHFRDHYTKLRSAAIKRKDQEKAALYDRIATDFQRFMDGEIPVWPSRRNQKAGRFVPSPQRSLSLVQ
jgi:hypothetical protein